ncbi:hypothetical protein HOLleu_12689 [Holothuria leucospilota]|uniref:Uncharacterized protein n=1 Tax=Holothuria leucospilota TaxID=206669 RepID=A0A9Q1CBB7_HOLLE|nr:hypothetical protein HOLleu_12689 [Holothuria leucospilota]
MRASSVLHEVYCTVIQRTASRSILYVIRIYQKVFHLLHFTLNTDTNSTEKWMGVKMGTKCIDVL